MTDLHEITSESDFDSHISSLPSSALQVLFFYTPWAAPCTQMRTVLSTLASTYPATSPPEISFLSINAEDLPDISETYDVTVVPFVVLLRGGTLLQSISGSDVVKVREVIEKHAGTSNSSSAKQTTIPPALSTTPRATTTTTAPTSTSALDNGTNGGENENGAAPPPPSKEELFTRLSELVKAAPVMLFIKGTPSAPQCGFSRQLVGILRENGVKYGFFNILADEDVRQALKEFADWPTYPQLWVKGELVGGLDIVKEEVGDNPDFLRDYAVPQAPSAAPA